MEFNLPAGTVVVTTKDVTFAGQAILYVSHDVDEEDGEPIWQFHAGDPDYSEGNLQLVRLDTILQLDASVTELADLPRGFGARRTQVGAAWNRFEEAK